MEYNMSIEHDIDLLENFLRISESRKQKNNLKRYEELIEKLTSLTPEEISEKIRLFYKY